jgi:hypothetical protein
MTRMRPTPHAYLLNGGAIEEAENRALLHLGAFKPIAELSAEEVLELDLGDGIRKVQLGSAEYGEWVSRFMETSHPFDWFLFMHPSGAGATCCRRLRWSGQAVGRDGIRKDQHRGQESGPSGARISSLNINLSRRPALTSKGDHLGSSVTTGTAGKY